MATLRHPLYYPLPLVHSLSQLAKTTLALFNPSLNASDMTFNVIDLRFSFRKPRFEDRFPFCACSLSNLIAQLVGATPVVAQSIACLSELLPVLLQVPLHPGDYFAPLAPPLCLLLGVPRLMSRFV